jgi:hypothetical protein
VTFDSELTAKKEAEWDQEALGESQRMDSDIGIIYMLKETLAERPP